MRKSQQAVDSASVNIKFDDHSAEVLGKAFWNIVEHYKIGRDDQAVLLGIKNNRQRLIDLEKKKLIPVDPDKYFRVAQLIGIHKSLRLLYPHNRNVVYDWMSTPREMFNGLSALDFIRKDPVNSLARLFTVRRRLDQIRVSL